jgi:hypothetical protein
MPTPEIVTLAEAKAYLRVDGTEDDAVVQSILDAATEAALAYADTFDPEVDETPARLKLAILGHIAVAYDQRENVDTPTASLGLARPLRTLDI